MTYEKLYNKILEIEDNELKCKFSIICDFLKKDYLRRRVENA